MKLFILLHFLVGLYTLHGQDDFAAPGLVSSILPDRHFIRNVLELPVNIISGFPPAVVSKVVSDACTAMLSKITYRYMPDLNDIKLVLRSACQNESYTLWEADKMAKSPLFDINKKVVIFSSGFLTTVNNSGPIDAFAKAYNCRGDTNFVALDVGRLISKLYFWSALNTEEIGRHLANGIVKLVKAVPMQNIHLMGHSLGAQIMGSAARNFHNITGTLLPYVTGLDPAKPCFKEGGKLTTLARGDAEFVDIVHSDPDVFGIGDAIGDVDYYPNGLYAIKPGCLDAICSHGRAVLYYVETVYPGHANDFLARRCSSMVDLRNGRCVGEDYAMGYAVPHNLRGRFFSEVNAHKPFGPNAKGDAISTESDCGRCVKK